MGGCFAGLCTFNWDQDTNKGYILCDSFTSFFLLSLTDLIVCGYLCVAVCRAEICGMTCDPGCVLMRSRCSGCPGDSLAHMCVTPQSWTLGPHILARVDSLLLSAAVTQSLPVPLSGETGLILQRCLYCFISHTKLLASTLVFFWGLAPGLILCKGFLTEGLSQKEAEINVWKMKGAFTLSHTSGEVFMGADKIKDQKLGTDKPVEAFKNQYCSHRKASLNYSVITPLIME